ncbi:MAG TPA: RNA polymerase sigma factor [Candidatus Eubacterium avistercoris]|uniref:RNA polymerase sigma factor n=1 Tax=Candidatus Eubacterium avistercoris TaxID=2838567 RepID=A0A9D2D265_9FIRM|nr:RNA polymerase sigma factor [Candidatus Eubacterium avistercoris]
MLILYTSLIETQEQKSKFELLYEKYYRLMLYMAMQALKDPMEAEDAVHTACIKIIKNLDKVDEVESPRTKRFLLTIIKHTAIDMIRKKNREKNISLEELEEWQLPADEGGMAAQSEENRIVTAIKHMPELYRDVFLLKYSSGYENREIADILEISEASVRKRISRGKKKLEALLNGENM